MAGSGAGRGGTGSGAGAAPARPGCSEGRRAGGRLPRRRRLLGGGRGRAGAGAGRGGGRGRAGARERGEGGGGPPGRRAHPPRRHPARAAPRRPPRAGPRRPLHLLPGQEVRGGPGGGRGHHVAGDGAGVRLAQRLGHPLQAPGEPRQEVGLRLGLRALQGPEAGPVQSRLAAAAPAPRARRRREPGQRGRGGRAARGGGGGGGAGGPGARAGRHQEAGGEEQEAAVPEPGRAAGGRARPPGEEAGEQAPGPRPLLQPGHPRLGQEPPDAGGGDVLRRHQQVPALQRGHLQQRPAAPGFPQPPDAERSGGVPGRPVGHQHAAADGPASLPVPHAPGRRRGRRRRGGGDLPEPVPAGALAGGLVPQPPLRPGAALAARHRRADGLPAQAAGQRQRLPALPGPRLRALLSRQPRRGVQNRALLGDAAPRAKAQRLRHPHGRGGGLHPGRLPHQRRAAGDDAAGGVLQGGPGPGEVSGAMEPGSDLPGQTEGLPGRPDPQRPELHPHPGADLQPAEAQQLRRAGARGRRGPGAFPAARARLRARGSAGPVWGSAAGTPHRPRAGPRGAGTPPAPAPAPGGPRALPWGAHGEGEGGSGGSRGCKLFVEVVVD